MVTVRRIVPPATPALWVALTLTLGAPAHADPLRLHVDWGRTLEQGQQWLLAGARAKVSLEMQAGVGSSGASHAEEPATPWLGIAPHLSVLGRDWNESYLFLGRLSATDVFRLTQSNRMLLTRVRFGDGIVVPFAQLGFGQWRVDTNVMPGWAGDTEVAAQVGAGVELRIMNVYSLAIESDYTVLYRDRWQPQDLPYPRFWGATAATRIRF
jgi:hypothetical protein